MNHSADLTWLATALQGVVGVPFGPNNGGKGTQVTRLVATLREFGVPSVSLSTGDAFRGSALKAATNDGSLISRASYIQIVGPAIDKTLAESGYGGTPFFLLDGGVREVYQAALIKGYFLARGYRRIALIHFQFDDWEGWEQRRVKRLASDRRPDDEFPEASRKLVEYLIRERAVIEACRNEKYDILPIKAVGTEIEVQQRLSRELTKLFR